MVLAVDTAIFSMAHSSSSLGRSQPGTDRSWKSQLLPAATTAAFCSCLCSLETVASSSTSDCSTHLSESTGTGRLLFLPLISSYVLTGKPPYKGFRIFICLRFSTTRDIHYMWIPRATFLDYPDPQQTDTRNFLLRVWILELAVWAQYVGRVDSHATLAVLQQENIMILWSPHKAPPPRDHKYSDYEQGLMTTEARTLGPQICTDPQIPGDISRFSVWVDMRQFQKRNCTILDTKWFKMRCKNAYFHHHSHPNLSGQCKDAFIFPETVIVKACLWSQGRFGFTCKNSLVTPICLVELPIPVACRNDISWDYSWGSLSSHFHGYMPWTLAKYHMLMVSWLFLD